MDVVFANPWGLLGLLSLPLLVLIHYFQRRSRTVMVSTLFLLPEVKRDTRSGRVFSFWRSSWIFWLQVLALILLTWLLAQPRWMRPDSVQHVAVVVDASASMSAFKKETLAGVREAADDFSDIAANTRWSLIESGRERAILYDGASASEMMAALEAFAPTESAHDTKGVLRFARQRVGPEGHVLLVTDHTPEGMPPGVIWMSVGREIDNAGFAGLTLEPAVDGYVWKVLIRNYSNQPQVREWYVENADGQRTQPRQAELPPRGSLSISGPMLEGVEAVRLQLEYDGFALDNQLPIVKPRSKPIRVQVRGFPRDTDMQWLKRLIEAKPGAQIVNEGTADIVFIKSSYIPAPPSRTLNRVLFYSEGSDAARMSTQPKTAERSPLVADLDFNGLLVRVRGGFEITEQDSVLLWQGERPLIFVRQRDSGKDLVFNFDPSLSNAARVPALILALHRFMDEVRKGIERSFAKNYELNESLGLYPNADTQLVYTVTSKTGNHARETIEPEDGQRLSAPGSPAYFTVMLDGAAAPLLTGAAHFADVREADFTAATESRSLSVAGDGLQEQHLRADILAPLWALLSGAALLASWYLHGRGSR